MSAAADDSIDYRPEDPAVLADPYPIYTRLRDEDPCHWSPRLKSWVLTRYDDVKRVCLDTAGRSSDRFRPFFAALPAEEAARIADIVRYLSQWMVFKDPPEHTRLRKLLSKIFHNRSMQAMRPQVEAITADLLGALRSLQGSRPDGCTAAMAQLNGLCGMVACPCAYATRDRALVSTGFARARVTSVDRSSCGSGPRRRA